MNRLTPNTVSSLIPLLLAVRVILDIICIATRNASYKLDLAYFLLFAAAGIAILVDTPYDLWGILSFGVALFSLGQFFLRRSRRSGVKDSSE